MYMKHFVGDESVCLVPSFMCPHGRQIKFHTQVGGGPITYGGEYFFTKGVNKHYKFWGVKYFYMQRETNVFHIYVGGSCDYDDVDVDDEMDESEEKFLVNCQRSKHSCEQSEQALCRINLEF